MKKIIFLYLNGCPYCKNAFKAIDELKATDKKFSELEIETVEEETQSERAKEFAEFYYYVPSMFVDGKKIYEAQPGESYEECRESVKKVFAAACG